jgi:hypothetical protein
MIQFPTMGAGIPPTPESGTSGKGSMVPAGVVHVAAQLPPSPLGGEGDVESMAFASGRPASDDELGPPESR